MYQLVDKAGRETGYTSTLAHPLTLEEWDIDYPSNAPHAWERMHAYEVRNAQGQAVGLWPHRPADSLLAAMGEGYTVHRVPV